MNTWQDDECKYALKSLTAAKCMQYHGTGWSKEWFRQSDRLSSNRHGTLNARCQSGLLHGKCPGNWDNESLEAIGNAMLPSRMAI